MRKKNKNNNENAQMQDMNTVQMDGANAAFAANVNFSGAILQDAEAMETLTEESGKKSKKAKKALAKKEKAKKKKEEYIEKKGLLGNADDYHVYHMKPVDTLTGYLMGVAAVAAGAYIFFYSIPFSIISGGGVTCDINAKNYFINQTVSVTIKREGAIPEVFSYIGMDGVSSDITVTATAASCDGAEFVRNTDMVYDFVTFLSDRLHISDKISYLKEKVQGVFQEDAKEAANAAG